MASLNVVHLIGNLTRDPEIKYTPKGTAVGNFALAVNRKYTADNGEKKEEVVFVECTAWGTLAETIGKYLAKGSPIFLGGRLTMDKWEDKQTGQKRTQIKVCAEQIQFLNKREDSGNGEQRTDQARQQPARPQQQRPQQPNRSAEDRRILAHEAPVPTDDLDGSDIPF